ncbi:uncharacterized protein LOC143023429 [Oratosquilla oratoria]|uniref:uncharacterized protein LOC143023429 n=1 Tax=Oratosquilla oratoria TaxID=337810 RepID=UPI003F76FE30
MDKAEYHQKALSLLQDSQTYTIILHDPTKKLQMKVEHELKELKDKHLITENDWRKMRPGDSIIPKFYGLPKMHKDNIPLRPIIAFRESPTYNWAANLSKRLRPLVTNSSHMLLNSEDFVNRIKGVKLDQGDVMVSFDVQSMFTLIPQGLAKRTLSKTMEETLGLLENQILSSTELMGLISMCLDSTYFRLREHIYHQRKGIPMGSPISVVVAEVVMQQFEAELLRTVPPPLKLWVRYVDDLFTVMQDKDIDPFFTRLNSLEPAIQFSMELEINGVLPFLDILVS